MAIVMKKHSGKAPRYRIYRSEFGLQREVAARKAVYFIRRGKDLHRGENRLRYFDEYKVVISDVAKKITYAANHYDRHYIVMLDKDGNELDTHPSDMWYRHGYPKNVAYTVSGRMRGTKLEKKMYAIEAQMLVDPDSGSCYF
ncbi:hypothetical protein [Levilactobacillus humaensis]|uniref:hypothetical protein n=1 Tax=Levilactobacillus humaensis TaxID=2950375 RepID=UPI0021C2F97C|nr:hypothetical protein [Levilactobacillus humaensis]